MQCVKTGIMVKDQKNDRVIVGDLYYHPLTGFFVRGCPPNQTQQAGMPHHIAVEELILKPRLNSNYEDSDPVTVTEITPEFKKFLLTWEPLLLLIIMRELEQ